MNVFLLHDFESMEEAAEVCGQWIKYYNEERPHQELGNLSPDEWLAEQLIDLAKKHNCAIITAHGTDTAKTRPQTPID